MDYSSNQKLGHGSHVGIHDNRQQQWRDAEHTNKQVEEEEETIQILSVIFRNPQRGMVRRSKKD